MNDIEVIRWFGIGALFCIFVPLIACDVIQRRQGRKDVKGIENGHGR